MSPIPSIFEINGCALNGSKSSMCSPVPMKVMGLWVAATLEGGGGNGGEGETEGNKGDEMGRGHDRSSGGMML